MAYCLIGLISFKAIYTLYDVTWLSIFIFFIHGRPWCVDSHFGEFLSINELFVYILLCICIIIYQMVPYNLSMSRPFYTIIQLPTISDLLHRVGILNSGSWMKSRQKFNGYQIEKTNKNAAKCKSVPFSSDFRFLPFYQWPYTTTTTTSASYIYLDVHMESYIYAGRWCGKSQTISTPSSSFLLRCSWITFWEITNKHRKI